MKYSRPNFFIIKLICRCPSVNFFARIVKLHSFFTDWQILVKRRAQKTLGKSQRTSSKTTRHDPKQKRGHEEVPIGLGQHLRVQKGGQQQEPHGRDPAPQYLGFLQQREFQSFADHWSSTTKCYDSLRPGTYPTLKNGFEARKTGLETSLKLISMLLSLSRVTRDYYLPCLRCDQRLPYS